jgi:hypothetical protein
MIERRSEPRRRSLLGATVVYGRRQCAMDCIVRNISPHGALVVFPNSAVIPSELELHIPHREQTFAARVVWRGHDRAGLALSDTPRA